MVKNTKPLERLRKLSCWPGGDLTCLWEGRGDILRQTWLNVTVFSRTPSVQRCSPVKMERKVKCKESADPPPSPLSCWTLVGQRDEHLDIVEGKEARLAVQHSLVPVLVDLVG